MIIFYDFDGTLTPYPVPRYEILKACDLDAEGLTKKVEEVMQSMHIGIYDAYFDVMKTVLMEKGFKYNKDVISTGAESAKLNLGVLDFLKNMHNKGIKQYIITSGYSDYVKKTPVAMYIDGVVGTEFLDTDLDGKLDKILTDEDKVNAIKDICQKENIPLEKTVYMGDGLTDKDAFSLVHSMGGKSIFIGENNDTYEVFNSYNIIDASFPKDFTNDSNLTKYVNRIITDVQV